MGAKVDERTRDWTCVIYPESAPENFKEIIDSWHVPAFLAFHDEDIEVDLSTPGHDVSGKKKEHYHLMVMFPGKKSYNQVKELFDQIKGVGCFKVNNCQGMARYFCHLDNPDKKQYPREHVMNFGGANYIEYVATTNDVIEIVKDMSRYIIENKVKYLQDLFLYADENGKTDWLWIMISKHTLWIRSLCDSIRKKERDIKESRIEAKEDRKVLLVDRETGEVVENIE